MADEIVSLSELYLLTLTPKQRRQAEKQKSERKASKLTASRHSRGSIRSNQSDRSNRSNRSNRSAASKSGSPRIKKKTSSPRISSTRSATPRSSTTLLQPNDSTFGDTVTLSSRRRSTRRSSLLQRFGRKESALFHRICKEIMAKKHVPDDSKDVPSTDPSYTDFRVPYEMFCAERYKHTAGVYERQFQHELRGLLALQPNAYEMAKFRRILSITTLWPPLHNRKELRNTKEHIFKRLNRNRINYLMEHDVF